MTRLLFSGDRFHDDPALIGAGLDRAAAGHKAVALVHGRCDPRTTNAAWIAAHRTDRVPWDVAVAEPWHGSYLGGDWHAHWHAVARGWAIEAVSADWATFGKAAGGIRNQVMVNRGAWILIAAPVPGRSKGTYDCIRRAKAAGIPVDDLSRPPEPEGLW